MDAISYLTRHFVNVNSERPNNDPVQRVPRPFEDLVPAALETISLSDFNSILEGV